MLILKKAFTRESTPGDNQRNADNILKKMTRDRGGFATNRTGAGSPMNVSYELGQQNFGRLSNQKKWQAAIKQANPHYEYNL